MPAASHVSTHLAGADQAYLHSGYLLQTAAACGVVLKTYMLTRMSISRTEQRGTATAAVTEKKVSVLFVCMGNICRSPTAEGMFRKHVADAGLSERIHVESAGTHAYHAGAPPDRRAQEAAARRGITLTHIRARRISDEDFESFDYIFAMDKDNLDELLERAPGGHRDKVRLFLDFVGTGRTAEVPDPYYGGASGFELVLDLVEQASQRLLQRISSGLR
jgi:protein-tyrosine phosphatase